MSDILQRLSYPFPPANVSWRISTTSRDKSKGMAVCYIDSRDVQRRLDLVMGTDWADELIVQPGLVTCRIGLYIDGIWRWRQDGTGTVREKKVGDEDLTLKEAQEREMHLKGAASDAFKRAAVKWGIGRYLYDIDSPWVQIDEYRNIKPQERDRLRVLLDQHLAAWREKHKLAAVETASKPAASAPPLRAVDPPRAAAPAADDDAPEPGSFEPDAPDDGGDWLEKARHNNDFSRIEKLLERNCRTRGDVERIIKAPVNLDAMKAWPDTWKEYMRERIRDARARTEENRPATAAA